MPIQRLDPEKIHVALKQSGATGGDVTAISELSAEAKLQSLGFVPWSGELSLEEREQLAQHRLFIDLK